MERFLKNVTISAMIAVFMLGMFCIYHTPSVIKAIEKTKLKYEKHLSLGYDTGFFQVIIGEFCQWFEYIQMASFFTVILLAISGFYYRFLAPK